MPQIALVDTPKEDRELPIVCGTEYDFFKHNGWIESYDQQPSLTRQEFAEDCDINVIMARFEKTGMLPANSVAPSYVDWTAMPHSLLEYMEFMRSTEGEFMKLPAVVRKEFDNDPVAFAEFAVDPQNLEQMREWGLAPPAPAVSSVEPPAEKAPAPGAGLPAQAPAASSVSSGGASSTP